METWQRTFLLLSGHFCTLLLSSCAPTITPPARETCQLAAPATPPLHSGPPPTLHVLPPLPDGTRELILYRDRLELPGPDLGVLPISFLPDSLFAGPSPYGKTRNFLGATCRHPDQDREGFSALSFRTTSALLQPALVPEEKVLGTLFYQTSIMMVSTVEARLLHSFRQRGWHLVISLPSDSFYRLRLPVYLERPTPVHEDRAVRYLAAEMDRHYREQAAATRRLRAFISKEYSTWLRKRQILMATSAGTFTAPAVFTENPDAFDATVLISPGANLIDTFVSGAADILPNTLSFIDTIRDHPPHRVTHLPSRQEFLNMYQKAARLTLFHPAALAPQLRQRPLLVLHGTRDHILPRSELETLYQMSGRPERWTYPLGHHLVALNLLTQISRLEKWMLKTSY